MPKILELHEIDGAVWVCIGKCSPQFDFESGVALWTLAERNAAVREARERALEEAATVAECWRDGNPTAVADIGWTGRTIAKAIRALKIKGGA